MDWLFKDLDVVGLDVDGGGEVALLEVDEEAFVPAAFLAHETTFKTIEAASDDAYGLAIELGRDLVVAVILHHVDLRDGLHEPLDVIVVYGHGLELLASSHIAVLEQGDHVDNGVKLLPGLVHEDKVGHEGDKAHYTFAKLLVHMLFEGHKDATGHLGHLQQLLVSGILGIGACQIAQHIPAVFHRMFNVDIDFFIIGF